MSDVFNLLTSKSLVDETGLREAYDQAVVKYGYLEHPERIHPDAKQLLTAGLSPREIVAMHKDEVMAGKLSGYHLPSEILDKIHKVWKATTDEPFFIVFDTLNDIIDAMESRRCEIVLDEWMTPRQEYVPQKEAVPTKLTDVTISSTSTKSARRSVNDGSDGARISVPATNTEDGPGEVNEESIRLDLYSKLWSMIPSANPSSNVSSESVLEWRSRWKRDVAEMLDQMNLQMEAHAIFVADQRRQNLSV
eukprot:GHVH01003544.1.p1 GENE.GHVH01003544.1~~GHVH01003544.1.p1  ORF type:complete len:249 (+),score=45.23 GHVH01003544.1:89-835(+)